MNSRMLKVTLERLAETIIMQVVIGVALGYTVYVVLVKMFA